MSIVRRDPGAFASSGRRTGKHGAVWSGGPELALKWAECFHRLSASPPGDENDAHNERSPTARQDRAHGVATVIADNAIARDPS